MGAHNFVVVEGPRGRNYGLEWELIYEVQDTQLNELMDLLEVMLQQVGGTIEEKTSQQRAINRRDGVRRGSFSGRVRGVNLRPADYGIERAFLKLSSWAYREPLGYDWEISVKDEAYRVKVTAFVLGEGEDRKFSYQYVNRKGYLLSRSDRLTDLKLISSYFEEVFCVCNYDLEDDW